MSWFDEASWKSYHLRCKTFLFRPNASRVIEALTRALVTLIKITYSVPGWINRRCFITIQERENIFTVWGKTRNPLRLQWPKCFSVVLWKSVLIGDENDLLAGLFLSAFCGVNLCPVRRSPSRVRRGWDRCEVCWMEQGPTRSPNTHTTLTVQRQYSQLCAHKTQTTMKLR